MYKSMNEEIEEVGYVHDVYLVPLYTVKCRLHMCIYPTQRYGYKYMYKMYM